MEDQDPPARRVVQFRPSELDLLQLAENLVPEGLNGVVVAGLGRVRSELAVQEPPSEPQRSAEGEGAVGEPEVQQRFPFRPVRTARNPPFPSYKRPSPDRPGAVQGAKRRSEPLTARTDPGSSRARGAVPSLPRRDKVQTIATPWGRAASRRYTGPVGTPVSGGVAIVFPGFSVSSLWKPNSRGKPRKTKDFKECWDIPPPRFFMPYPPPLSLRQKACGPQRHEKHPGFGPSNRLRKPRCPVRRIVVNRDAN